MVKFVLAAVLLLIAPLAHADTRGGSELQRDQIIISLQKEGWVTTTTANVSVNFDIVQQKETALDLKNQIMASLSELSQKSLWRITSSQENKDRTGLNRWHVRAEARVPEDAVSGLNDRAEKASRPGFSLRIGRVDFSPSLEEMEVVRSELRAQIYKDAFEEAKRLNLAIQGQSYHVFKIDFGQAGNHPTPMLMRTMGTQSKEMAMNSDAAGGGVGGAELAVSRRQMMSAVVVLTSEFKKEK